MDVCCFEAESSRHHHLVGFCAGLETVKGTVVNPEVDDAVHTCYLLVQARAFLRHQPMAGARSSAVEAPRSQTPSLRRPRGETDLRQTTGVPQH